MIKVASIQTDIIWEDSASNKIYYDLLLKDFQQVDLIIFPEMFTTGFSMNHHKIAEKPYGETVSWMQSHAQSLNTCIVGSIAINENNQFYNRLYVVKPNEIKYYDKRYLFSMASEDKSYSKGKKSLIFEINGWKINPLICYDLRFPLWSRNKFSNSSYKYDILIYIANWPSVRTFAWNNLLSARAIENSAYVFGVNRIGTDGNKNQYNGSSRTFDFKGERLDNFKINEPQISIHSLHKKELNNYRTKFPVLKDADNFTFQL
ncbi:amidohydrolase [bacterium]|nr:amidohydrolase [bacterium]